MNIHQRLIQFVTRSNWIIFAIVSLAALILTTPAFTLGTVFGGLIVTINFHLLSRTLKSALTPPFLSSHHIILAKYYLRFVISGVIIFFLIRYQVVNPLGLFIGLSVVVASIMLATLIEVKKLIFKEAV